MPVVKLEEKLANKSENDIRSFLKTFYDNQYSNGKYHPANGLATWKKLLELQPRFIRGLDVGCGTGDGLGLAVKSGLDVYGIDLADATRIWKKHGVDKRCRVASATKIPYPDNYFDFVMSADVLEHIPEFDIDAVLSEIYRVSSRKVFLIVCLGYENRPVDNEIYTHITVKPFDWWIDKYKGVGFIDILNNFGSKHMISWMTKPAWRGNDRINS